MFLRDILYAFLMNSSSLNFSTHVENASELNGSEGIDSEVKQLELRHKRRHFERALDE